MIVLSILICAVDSRVGMLHNLMRNIDEQVNRLGVKDKVEVLVEMDNRVKPTGTKRNILLSRAKGKYVCFVDEDDEIYIWYVEEILKGALSDCDCMAINGIMTTDLKNAKRWFIAKDLTYCASTDEHGREIYLRYTNHLAIVKREIAIQIKFPDIIYGEDYRWATDLKNSGLLKTEYVIPLPLYHYKFSTNK